MVNILARQMNVKVLTGAEMLIGKDLLEQCMRAAVRTAAQQTHLLRKQRTELNTGVENHPDIIQPPSQLLQ